MKHVEIGIGYDVGGHGKRQQQRPFQHAPAREIIGRHQPGCGGADHRRNEADTGQQDDGIRHRGRQDRGKEMAPEPRRSLDGFKQQPGNRQEDDKRDHARKRQPAAAWAFRRSVNLWAY